MVSLVIILALIYAFYTGTRRGLVLQIVYTLGYSIVFWIARFLSPVIGPKLKLLIPYPSATEESHFAFFHQTVGLSLDKAFYIGVAFLMVMFIGGLIVRFVGLLLNSLTYFPILHKSNKWLAGLLSLGVVYVGIFLIIYVLALVPVAGLQTGLDHSWLPQTMVLRTPFLTRMITEWWITL